MGLGFYSGFKNTLRHLLGKSVTIQYPKERRDLPPRTRGAVVMNTDEEGKPKCVGCGLCVKACPDRLITMVTSPAEGDGKVVEYFHVELGRCMYCGFCVAACAFDAIDMSSQFELATHEKARLTERDMLHELRRPDERPVTEEAGQWVLP